MMMRHWSTTNFNLKIIYFVVNSDGENLQLSYFTNHGITYAVGVILLADTGRITILGHEIMDVHEVGASL